MLAVNLRAPMVLTRRLAPAMAQAKGGMIVNIGERHARGVCVCRPLLLQGVVVRSEAPDQMERFVGRTPLPLL